MPKAPCPIAAIVLSTDTYFTSLDRSRRLIPAIASIIASNSPSLSLAILEFTFPRSEIISKSGLRARSCILLRKDVVPTLAPFGSSSKLLKFILSIASFISSLLQTQANFNPSGKVVGTSFKLCTAISALPSSIAFSSSLVNKPLPPILANGVSKITSPLVFIVIISTL